MNDDEALARKRFMVLSLMRLGGAFFLTVGLLAIAGKIALMREVAYGFVVVGMLDFLFVPWWLAKRWKSPGQ